MDNENYADFISYYRDNIEDEKSYPAFVKLNREFNSKDARLDSQQGKQIETLDLKMDGISKPKTVDVTASKHILREEYKGKAEEAARSYGFKGKSFDEHIKEQETKQERKQEIKQPEPKTTGNREATSQLSEQEKRRQAFLQEMQQTGKGITKEREL